jgi:hypothetical protein
MEYSRSQLSAITDMVQFISAHSLTKNACQDFSENGNVAIRCRIQREIVITWVGNQNAYP